jgi:hypothetical protein
VKSREAFGVSFKNKELAVFPHNREQVILKLKGDSNLPISVELNSYTGKNLSWKVTSAGNYHVTVEGLDPAEKYTISINGKSVNIEVNRDGEASFSYSCIKPTLFSLNGKLG